MSPRASSYTLHDKHLLSETQTTFLVMSFPTPPPPSLPHTSGLPCLATRTTLADQHNCSSSATHSNMDLSPRSSFTGCVYLRAANTPRAPHTPASSTACICGATKSPARKPCPHAARSAKKRSYLAQGVVCSFSGSAAHIACVLVVCLQPDG
jgi:hypothetical protein